MMNAVLFYSNTEQSKSVASFLANQLGYPLIDLETGYARNFQKLVLVFPVHCQNIPAIVKDFLNHITVTYLAAVATYGKMGSGNVLYEIQQKYQKNIIAGAYIPTKHSYIEEDDAFEDFDKLLPLVEKIKNPSFIQLPKLYKNPLADVFPSLRSRIGLKINKKESCDGCNACQKHCSFQAIKAGVTNQMCIRCLRCVAICPQKALEVKIGWPLKLYLRKKKVNKTILYV